MDKSESKEHQKDSKKIDIINEVDDQPHVIDKVESINSDELKWTSTYDLLPQIRKNADNIKNELIDIESIHTTLSQSN